MRDCYYSKYEPLFGSWRITEEIGAGSEGHLYRITRDDALGNAFYSALKAITVPAAGEAEIHSLIAGGMKREEAISYYDGILENTVQEFELLEKLKGNSNIVSYEDHEIFRRDEGFGWDILMRMEELTPLVKHSINHHMDEEELIRMGKELCRGLSVCRKFGIVHRDIKPENIFISSAGSYKLGDFGIARIIEETTTVLSRKGTYTYMAPEVYWGKDYDHTVDIYSLGLVIYRYLNDGRMPFMPVYPEPVGYQDGELAFAKRVGGSPVPEPRTGSEGLKAIVCKACAFDKEDRYAEPEDLMKDLESLEQGKEPVAVLEKTAAAREAARKRSKARKIAAAVVGLCVAASGITYALIPKEVEDIETAGLEDGAEIYIDEDLSPEYTVKPDWFKDEPVAFTTSDEKILEVDESGTLHAGKPGDAVLTMSAKEYSEDVRITVVPKVTSIEGIEENISLTTGNTLTLVPVLKPKKFASEEITYSVKDEKVATVTEEGVITAVAAGETKLTISAGGTSIKATVTVSDPVVYRSDTSGNSSSSSKSKRSSKSKSSSDSASKGYFDSSDDETF